MDIIKTWIQWFGPFKRHEDPGLHCLFVVRLIVFNDKSALCVTTEFSGLPCMEIMWSEDVNSVSTQNLWSEMKWSEVKWSGGWRGRGGGGWGGRRGFLHPEASCGDSSPCRCDLWCFYSCWRRKSGQDRIKPAPTHVIINLFSVFFCCCSAL